MSIYTRKLDDITILIIHCSGSDFPQHDNIETIRQWHLERGFDDVGYHYFIQKNGNIEIGRLLEKIGAHTLGYNSESVGICLGGSIDFTESQMISAAKLIDNLFLYLTNLKKTYGILPHRFFNVNKTCPNFELSRIFKYMESIHAIGKLGKYI